MSVILVVCVVCFAFECVRELFAICVGQVISLSTHTHLCICGMASLLATWSDRMSGSKSHHAGGE